MPGLMELLSYAGNAIDLPASSLRDLVTGANPFDQWATPFSEENRTSGRDMLNPIFGANKETGMAGWLDDPMEGVADVLGFGAEMVLDPLNAVSGAGVMRALKGRKAAKSVNKVIAVENAANAGKYGYVNAKLAGQADELVNPITQQAPQKLLGYIPAPENPMFPGREVMHHGGRDMSASATKEHPYGTFDLGRLKTGEGNNMFSPGAYKADAESTSSFYRDLIQKDITTKSTQTPMYQLRNVIDDFTDGMSEEVDVNSLRKFFQMEADNPIMAKAGELFDIIDRNDYFGADKNDLFFWEEMQDAMSSKGGLEKYLGTNEAVSSLANYTTDRYAGQARLYGFDAPAGTKDSFLKWENPISEQPQAVQNLIGDPSKMFSPEQIQLMEQAREANLRWVQAGDKLKEINSNRYLQETELVGNTLKEKAAYLRAARKQAELDAFSAQQQYQVLKNKLLDQNVPYDIATGRFHSLNEMDGEAIVELLLGAKPSEASLADTIRMRDAGVPGVKNLANSTGGSTYNYAIWDQGLLNKMRVRMIDGQRVPINPTTLVQQVAQPLPRAADPSLIQSMNPMRPLQQLPGMAAPVAASAVYNILARQNNYGGVM